MTAITQTPDEAFEAITADLDLRDEGDHSQTLVICPEKSLPPSVLDFVTDSQSGYALTEQLRPPRESKLKRIGYAVGYLAHCRTELPEHLLSKDDYIARRLDRRTERRLDERSFILRLSQRIYFEAIETERLVREQAAEHRLTGLWKRPKRDDESWLQWFREGGVFFSGKTLATLHETDSEQSEAERVAA